MVQVHGLLVNIRFKCVISIWERRVYERIVFGQFYSPLDSICGRSLKSEKRKQRFSTWATKIYNDFSVCYSTFSARALFCVKERVWNANCVQTQFIKVVEALENI